MSDRTVKRYGNAQDSQLAEPYPFELSAIDGNDDEVVFRFTATRKADRRMAARFTSLDDDVDLAELLGLIGLVVGKTLSNVDGVKRQWRPDPLPRTEDMSDEDPDNFRDPDGVIRPMPEAEKFLTLEAASSRRRWDMIMADPLVQVEPEDLVEMTKDLIEVTAQRPTVGSSPS